MNNKLVTLMLAGVMALGSLNAEAARRMGGGKSVGQQSNQVTKRDAAPQTPAAPAQNAAPTNAAKPAAAPAAAAPKKPWGAMLGGLAAGLGLAWLASSLGLGEAFGNILMGQPLMTDGGKTLVVLAFGLSIIIECEKIFLIISSRLIY
jgi:hypothetical protein